VFRDFADLEAGCSATRQRLGAPVIELPCWSGIVSLPRAAAAKFQRALTCRGSSLVSPILANRPRQACSRYRVCLSIADLNGRLVRA